MQVKATICKPVFFTSAGLIVALLGFTLLLPETSIEFFIRIKDVVSVQFGWLYIISVVIFLGFCIWLLFSRYAGIKLGKDDEEPDYSRTSWYAMLFAAGMGISLVFYGVAEPLLHYADPPVGLGGTPEAAGNALPLTFHHWGFHAWAIYVVIALPIAYFAYRRDLPLSLRSCFYPVLGKRIYGWMGHSIDILAVFGTLFGLATSLALGAISVSVGLNHLFGFSHSTSTQIIIIAVITLAATISLVSGMDKGIKRMSEANMILAGLLLIFVFVFGPTSDLILGFFQGFVDYLADFGERSFEFGQSDPSGESKWLQDWSIFYWGWWIAWAPFVGVFVARISRGRTIRDFVLSVLLIPPVVTLVWFAVFGGTALSMGQESGAILKAINIGPEAVQGLPSVPEAGVYFLLEQLPLASITTFFAAIVLVIFFVSSSDSASYVVDMLTSGGNPDPPVWQRIFWATLEGAIAAILLYAGGTDVLNALKAGVVALGLPICILLLIMCFSLVRGLRSDPRFAKGTPRLKEPDEDP